MNNELKSIVEGILFVVGDEGITLKQLSSVVEINENNLSELMSGYIEEYNSVENRGIEIAVFGGVYKLITKSSVHDYCQKLFEDQGKKEFSQAALETLAIIAYKQPITRVEIEEIRGVSCDMMLKKLQAKNLIKEAGRLDTPGLPYTYEVTQQFMDTFSLASLDELPQLPDYQKETEDRELFD